MLKCEPFITSDNFRSMIGIDRDVLDGACFCMKYLNLREGTSSRSEENKPDAIENLNRLIQQNGIDNIEVFQATVGLLRS